MNLKDLKIGQTLVVAAKPKMVKNPNPDGKKKMVTEDYANQWLSKNDNSTKKRPTSKQSTSNPYEYLEELELPDNYEDAAKLINDSINKVSESRYDAVRDIQQKLADKYGIEKSDMYPGSKYLSTEEKDTYQKAWDVANADKHSNKRKAVRKLLEDKLSKKFGHEHWEKNRDRQRLRPDE